MSTRFLDKYYTLVLDNSRNLRCVLCLRRSIGAFAGAGFLLRLDRAVPESQIEVLCFLHRNCAQDQVRVHVNERRVGVQQGQRKSFL